MHENCKKYSGNKRIRITALKGTKVSCTLPTEQAPISQSKMEKIRHCSQDFSKVSRSQIEIIRGP